MINLNNNLKELSEETYTEKIFEDIKHINEYDQEFWYARELSKVLGYKDFRNFELIIFKAMENCKNSNQNIDDHFGETTEMVNIGSNAKREFKSYKLSRYAAYLTVLNANPIKKSAKPVFIWLRGLFNSSHLPESNRRPFHYE